MPCCYAMMLYFDVMICCDAPATKCPELTCAMLLPDLRNDARRRPASALLAAGTARYRPTSALCRARY
eukprot:821488-Rhodomonas_salina.1